MSNANALHRLAVLSGHITPAGACDALSLHSRMRRRLRAPHRSCSDHAPRPASAPGQGARSGQHLHPRLHARGPLRRCAPPPVGADVDSHAPRCGPPCAGPCAPSLARQPTRATTAQAPSSDSKGFSRAFPQAESAAAFPAAGWDMLALDALLTPEERALRDRVRAFMVRPAHAPPGHATLLLEHPRALPAAAGDGAEGAVGGRPCTHVSCTWRAGAGGRPHHHSLLGKGGVPFPAAGEDRRPGHRRRHHQGL